MSKTKLLKSLATGGLLAGGAGMAGVGLYNMIKGVDASDKEVGRFKKLLKSDDEVSDKKINLLVKSMGILNKVSVARSTAELKKKIRSVSGYDQEEVMAMAKELADDVFKMKEQAVYVAPNPDNPDNKNHLIVIQKKVNLAAVAHELGHAKDLELAGGTEAWSDKYKKKIHEHVTGLFSSEPYKRTERKAEEMAWQAVPEDIEDKSLRSSALNTYDLGEGVSMGLNRGLVGGSMLLTAALLNKKRLMEAII